MFNHMKKTASFWLTNISKRNVSIADLNLTVKALSSVNLLDKRHYSYTLEQLQKSVKSGSVFKKRHFLKVRNCEPLILEMGMPLIKETFIPSREKSVLEIKEEYYEELSISDEKFAEQNADLAEDV